VIGDIAAHCVVGGVKQFAGWQKQAGQNLAENVAEYFTAEHPKFVKPSDLTTFSNDITHLNDDLASLKNTFCN